MNLPPFYVGQKVVAIRDHSGRMFTKGEVFIVHAIQKCFCKCSEWDIHIGFTIQWSNYSMCTNCGDVALDPGNFHWFAHICFAPVEESFQSISYEKVLEEEKKFISVN